MAVRVTNQYKAAIYDSVTGYAFGPTFSSEEEADDFLDFLSMNYSIDPRLMTSTDFDEARGKFFAEREGEPQAGLA